MMLSRASSMKICNAVVSWFALLSLLGCAANRGVLDYLPDGAVSPQGQSLIKPLSTGLLFAIPETELKKPTALNTAEQGVLAKRIQRQLEESGQIEVTKVLPTIILHGDGHGALSWDQLRQVAEQAQLPKLFIVVPTSQSAQRVQPYPIIESQLFARMDLALLVPSTNQVLVMESGQDDYVLSFRRDVERTISFPRIYYRTQTTSGPFLVVDTDPYPELGKVAFEGAADQIVMRLLDRLKTP